ncbi:MAG: ornithine cyclodeaminase [Pseudomonadota bacterium]
MRMLDAETMEAVGDWAALVDRLEAAHRAPKAEVKDLLMQDAGNAWLTRAAWVPGGALGLKSVSVFPGNAALSPPRPSVQGAFLLFDGATGEIAAVLDGAAITAWKTVADSMLGARFLAREDVESLLIVGAGTIGARLAEAWTAIRPSLRQVRVWNRGGPKAEALAARLSQAAPALDIAAAPDLEAAAREADAISCATMTVEPILRGAWLKPGAHLDLIGAYRPDMREADDEALTRGRLFVDARETTIGEIGELMIPMAAGVIGEADVLADHRDLAAGAEGRRSADEITVFKNGGGAHLDLMTAGFFLDRAG